MKPASVSSRGDVPQSSPRPRPAYLIFGRTPWDAAWMPWHSLAHRLARTRPVVYVQDPAARAIGLRGGRVERRPDGIADVALWAPPMQRVRFVRDLVRRMHLRLLRSCLGRQTRPLVAVLAPRAPLQLASALRPDLTVFLAIDDLSQAAGGGPDERYLEWERAALVASDLVIGASDAITARLRGSGARAARTITNGFDEEHLDGRAHPVPTELAGVRRPVVGFAGTVRAERLDIDLLERAALARPLLSFVFVGEEIDGAAGALARLRRLPNVRFLPHQGRDRVAAFLAAFDVALVPYRNTAVNRACYPLKVLDALAMGRPVVLTPERPDLRALGPGLRTVPDLGSLLAALDESIAEGNGAEASRARRSGVETETWDRKAALFEEAVDAALAGRRTGAGAG